MEDPLTEEPPPSRFFDEDLNNFTPPSPSLSSPSLHFTNPNTTLTSLSPSLLIIALSSPSIHLIHQISSKTLIGTLILPEISTSQIEKPSPKDKSCYIYSLNDSTNTLFVSFQFSIPAERAHSIAKFLFEKILPEKVLILESIQSRNFRGKLPPDEELMFKLETLEEKCCLGDLIVKDLEYFPCGSLIDGLAAAILARCQLKKIRATLVVSWPELGRSAVEKVKSLLQGVLPDVNFNFSNGDLGVYRIRNSRANSEMYT
ncbi:hypothetical protein AQUCO_00700540v1 [Aquilegia coerulea]|uniref:Uncharacterized protein n=1 Tax=Aquilegia coerulea TaxID=218851 RepID=A0A2G5EKH6_AQUCA|nr:hypothetical protein AQUCO_00700540v1 [Aquilegia coerulea]